MTSYFYIPFFLQIALISFDEFYFHVKRGLPKWERIGHPLDTLSIVVCFLYVILFSYSLKALIPFIILATLSCILVTKDEWVHKEVCDGKEQWLHAMLFINHPLVLISLGIMWAQGFASFTFLMTQFICSAAFCLYQTIYWNLVWKPK
jgi:hypothetical protein